MIIYTYFKFISSLHQWSISWHSFTLYPNPHIVEWPNDLLHPGGLGPWLHRGRKPNYDPSEVLSGANLPCFEGFIQLTSVSIPLFTQMNGWWLTCGKKVVHALYGLDIFSLGCSGFGHNHTAHFYVCFEYSLLCLRKNTSFLREIWWITLR